MVTQNPTTLYEYYTSRGQALPSVSQRMGIASQAGISGYTGSASQNNQLLSYLLSQGSTNQTNAQLPSSQSPSNAGQVTTNSQIQTPTGSPTTPDTSSVSGLISYYQSQFQTAEQQRKDAEAARAAAEDQQKNQTQPFLDRILGAKSPDQVRSEAQAKTGIDPTQYFADQKARIAEIDSLNKEYAGVVEARDAAIAQTNDKMASNSFINNQIAQINRNAAPRLNTLSANINSKAASLQASQGLFNEAQDYVNKAVNDATADLKFNVDMFNEFYDLNQSVIDKLDVKYQNAIKDARDSAESAYKLAYSEKQDVGNLILKYPNAGISITDNYDQAISKVNSSPKVTTTGSGGGGSSTTTPKFTSTQINKGTSIASTYGLTTAQFNALPYEDKNMFINNPKQWDGYLNVISGITTGKEDMNAVITEIKGSNLSPTLKSILYQKAIEANTAKKKPGFFKNLFS